MIRPAYPDELARARALCPNGAIPESAQFLVAVVEHPVERLIAAFPYWPSPTESDTDTDSDSDTESEHTTMEFALHLTHAGSQKKQLTDDALKELETAASNAGASRLRCQASVPDTHPFFKKLTDLGYVIVQTDRHFSAPGEIAKNRGFRVYKRLGSRIPKDWVVESIRGHTSEDIFSLVAEHQLMTPQQFQQYWDTSNHEHFEEDYSCVMVDKSQTTPSIIGVFLVTQRGDNELHLHVEAAKKGRMSHSHIISTALRNDLFSHCPEGFPEYFTWRADSKKHREGGNVALRHGGEEKPPQHYLEKQLR